MSYEFLLVDRTDGIGTITLNRPEKLNAFAGRMRQELAECVRELAEDDDVRVLVVTGAGRAFCAGADIGYMKELIENDDTDGFAALVDAGRQVVTTVRGVAKPVIASINGPAAGGGANLALSCDFRIASEKASIGQTFNRLGLHPDWGGTYFLPRLVGSAKALELMLSGEMIPAQEALELGMFNRVVKPEELAEETDRVARMLVSKPPIAVALIKRAVYSSDSRTLPQMLAMELDHQLKTFESADAREGLSAFLEKRTPHFSGN